MLERVWRKGNPLTLLEGMQTSTTTMENSVEIPLKTGNRTAIRPSNPTAGHTHQGNQNWKRHVYLNVHRSTVTIARTWKQSGCPSADEWIRKLYTMEYYSAIKKEHIWISSSEVDETGTYYTEWSKSERKTPIQYNRVYIYIYIYMELRKMVTMILYERQQKRHRYKEQTLGFCGRRWGWDDLG